MPQRYGSTTVDVTGVELTPEEALRITRLARELRLTDQILSTDVDKVEVVPKGPAPAWTSLDGDKVSFAADRMPNPTSRLDLAVWLGTNAHELGHVLYSPRGDSVLMARIRSGEETYLRGIAMLHNIVEDQRQERLILARFSPWRGYLVAALGHHLIANDANAWLLMAGRTWIPDEVRAQARATFVAKRPESVADTVASLIGRYQRLTDPGDTESAEAWEILTELHALFEGEIPAGRTCTVIDAGQPDTGEPGDKAPAAADEAEVGDQPGASQPGGDDGGDPGEAASTGTRDAKADDVREGGESKRPEVEAKTATDRSGASENADGSDGGGAGNQSVPPTTTQAQRDAIREALRKSAETQIDGDEDASDELDDILDALDWGRGADEVSGEQSRGVYREVTDEARRLHREVSDALLDFKDASEPGWNKRTDSGRLNVRRLVNPATDADELFDRYEPGQMDASELEVVLLLDVSGSMNSHTAPLAEAAWAIRQAVDDLEGTITVLTYTSGFEVLAKPGERPDARMFEPAAFGGTDPESALGEAWQILAGSQAHNRMLVVMTDGFWTDNRRNEELIAAMRDRQVATVMAYFKQKGAFWADKAVDMHRCEFGGEVNDLAELPRLFQRVALAQMQSAWMR